MYRTICPRIIPSWFCNWHMLIPGTSLLSCAFSSILLHACQCLTADVDCHSLWFIEMQIIMSKVKNSSETHNEKFLRRNSRNIMTVTRRLMA